LFPDSSFIHPPAGQAVEAVGEAFKEDGKIGHQFTEKGAAGEFYDAFSDSSYDADFTSRDMHWSF
jgi:hypothetical protein